MSMKKNSFKRQLAVVVCMLLCGLSIQAAGDDLITDQIIISKLVAGTLPQRISSDEKNLITNLKINGEINGTDLRFIREMATSYDVYGIEQGGQLSILDLSDAKIVSGGEYYDDNYFTKDNEIGYMAFCACNRLTILTLPSSLTSIGNSAFYGCRGLTSVTLPSSLTSIGNSAFYGCSGLTSLTLPSSLTSIGNSAFESCSGLTSLTLPSSLTSIGNSAFESCSGLTSLTLPSSLTSIGYSAFRGCRGLTSVTLPSSLTLIGYKAFEGCSGLTSLTLPPSLTTIGDEAFAHCHSLASVTFPSSLASIGRKSFAYCYDLKILSIPSGITSLRHLMAFSEETIFGDSGLESVYVAWGTPAPAGRFFNGVNISKCTLYVPLGTKQAYWEADVWKDFGYTKEYDVTDVNKIDNHSETKEVSRYSLDGQRLASPTKGINIVRYSDGSIKKEMVE